MSKDDALAVLKDNYQELFAAYFEGLGDYNERISPFSPEVRTRLDAPMLNACIADSFISHFPDRYSVGRYGRILFRWEGITMLIKKLNRNSKPSYIPTLLSEGIAHQLQVPLFNGDEANADAVLMFGYTKNILGQHVNPRIILFDGEVQWVAGLDDITTKPAAHVESGDVVVRLKQQKAKEA